MRTVVGWLGDSLLEIRDSDGDARVTGLTISSQRVQPGDLYAAPAGSTTHGATFAAQAVAAGAVAVLTDPAGAEICAGVGVPVLVVPQPRAVLGALSALVYGEPAARLKLVAVTGTQGKTTTTRLAEAALTASGTHAAVVGTVGTRVNGVDVKTSLTTPEAPDLHALFAVMAERDVAACAMEVSSHALVMGRVDGVVFDVACFTNLGRDHLDFHADEEEYFSAKASLFTPQRTRLGLVNIDDEHGRRLVAEASVPVRTFSSAGNAADWQAADIDLQPGGSTFVVHTPGGDTFRGAGAADRGLQRVQRAVRDRGARRGRVRPAPRRRGDGRLRRRAGPAGAGRRRPAVPRRRRLRPQARRGHRGAQRPAAADHGPADHRASAPAATVTPASGR